MHPFISTMHLFIKSRAALLLLYLSIASALRPSDIPTDTPVSSLISSAKAHLASGEPREALLYFDAAVARDPSNYLTLFQRGATYLSLGKDAQATEDFNRVLELKPGFEEALVQRSRIRTRSGDWKGARQDLEKAGKKSSTEYAELVEAQKAAAQVEAAEKKGDWETCVAQAGTAISKASTALGLRQARARCRFEKGDIEEALSDLTHVLHLAPGSVEPHLQISYTQFYALGDTDRGVAQIRKCLHSDPDSKPCSRLFRRQKQIGKALEKLHGFMEKRKFSNAANLLVGTGGETGLIDDVKEDVKEARKAGYIHRKAPDNMYIYLVETACEAYRGVCCISRT